MKTPEQVAREIAQFINGNGDIKDAVIRCEPLLNNHTPQGRDAFVRLVKGNLNLPGAFIQIPGLSELDLLPGREIEQCLVANAA